MRSLLATMNTGEPGRMVSQRHRFAANQFRLLLAALAYTLMQRLRETALRGTELERASAATIRVRLLKIGAAMAQYPSSSHSAGLAPSVAPCVRARGSRHGPVALNKCCHRHAIKQRGFWGTASAPRKNTRQRHSQLTSAASDQITGRKSMPRAYWRKVRISPVSAAMSLTACASSRFRSVASRLRTRIPRSANPLLGEEVGPLVQGVLELAPPKPRSPSPLPPPISCWSSQVAPFTRA